MNPYTFEELVAMRRQLHQHPELSGQEVQTAAFIASHLQANGIAFSEVPHHHIVARIAAEDANAPTLILRADTDALPIAEAGNAPYKSQHAGVMHACGHDVHTTCLLGAAQLIKLHQPQLKNHVVLVFQGHEEVLPGGAVEVLQSPLLANLNPHSTAVVGLHVLPELPCGTLGFVSGNYMAATDELHVSFRGKGGHAAVPASVQNPAYAAAEWLLECEKIKQQLAEQGTVDFGRINFEGATNVIPSEIQLQGTMRSLGEDIRNHTKQQLRTVFSSILDRRNLQGVLDIREGYPSIYNHPELTALIRQTAIEMVGKDHVADLPPRLTGDDFGRYLQHFKGCYFRLGVGNAEKGIVSGVHTNTFDIDEHCLQIGSLILTRIALQSILYALV